jgi:hypothetical protein
MFLRKVALRLTVLQTAGRSEFMKILKGNSTVRLVMATLVTVAVIGLSALATHAPMQNQDRVTLKRIQTDNATTFYADHRRNAGIWFVEAVLPGPDSKAASDLKAVAATL